MSVEGKYIKLAEGLEPQSTKKERTCAQSSLLENWTRGNDLATDKKFVLGSKEVVSYDYDKGFFSTVMAAYNNHWVLKTRPEDWWTAILMVPVPDPLSRRPFGGDEQEVEVIAGCRKALYE